MHATSTFLCIKANVAFWNQYNKSFKILDNILKTSKIIILISELMIENEPYIN